MKLKLVAILLFLIPTIGFAQEITVSGINEFTDKFKIYTSWNTIKKGNTSNGRNHLEFMLRYENNKEYLHLKWVTNEIISIRKDSELLLKLDNGENLKLKALKFTTAERGAGGLPDYIGINAIYLGNLDVLSENIVTDLRIYTFDNYVDIEIKVKDALKINEAYDLLQEELEEKNK